MFLTYFIYSIVLFIPALIIKLIDYIKKSFLKQKLYFIPFIIIVIISTFRSINVGTDNENYFQWFESLQIDLGLSNLILFNIFENEPLFVLINYYIFYYGFKYTFAKLFYACILWTTIFHLRKYLKSIFSYFVFFLIISGFLFFTFNAIRQSLAVGFVFLSSIYLINRQHLRFLIVIIIASLFHYSALIFLFAFFINKLPKLSSFFWFFIFVFSLIIPTGYLIDLIARVTFFLPNYSFNDDFSNQRYTLGILYQSLLPFIILIFYKKYFNTKSEIFYVNTFFFGCILFNIFAGNMYITRITLYFTFFSPFILAIIFSKFLYPKNLILALTIFFYCLFLFYIKIFLNDSGCSPYIITF
jgi:hypothetical protein